MVPCINLTSATDLNEEAADYVWGLEDFIINSKLLPFKCIVNPLTARWGSERMKTNRLCNSSCGFVFFLLQLVSFIVELITWACQKVGNLAPLFFPMPLLYEPETSVEAISVEEMKKLPLSIPSCYSSLELSKSQHSCCKSPMLGLVSGETSGSNRCPIFP